jgi:thioesterase domain-containing protein
LTDVLLRAGAVPAGTTRAYLARFVELYQANVRAAAAYAPASPIAPPIHVIAAADRDAALGAAVVTDADLGWAAWSQADVDTVLVPGTHITMLRAPHVASLAAAICASLSKITVSGR